MSNPLQKLAVRRQHLITQAASQRALLAQNADSWHKPLAMADKGLNVLRYIKHHPIVVAGGGATLLSIANPNGITKWLRRSWFAWQLTKKIINK
jgi:hypothetical protein